MLQQCGKCGEAAKNIVGVTKVLHDAKIRISASRALTPIVVEQGVITVTFFFRPTQPGKCWPRGGLLDGTISDVVEIICSDTFVRPIYAGNAMAIVQSSDPIKVITVRGIAFAAAEPTGGSGTVETIAAIDDPALLISLEKS